MAQNAGIGLYQGFAVGMYVEAVYDNPTGPGRIRFNLMKDDDNIPLQFEACFDTNELAINTKADAHWLLRLEAINRPDGYDFSYGTRMAVKIQGLTRGFAIFINGKLFHQFIPNTPLALPCTVVSRIEFDWIMGERRVASKLHSLQIGYVQAYA